MFLVHKIKYDAFHNYNIYEKKIAEYYNIIYKDDNQFNKNNLTDYIRHILIQSHLSGVFYDTGISVCDVNKYIRNLYLSYYKYYIKDIINCGKDFIITKEQIEIFVDTNGKNKELQETTEWIYKQTSTNITLDKFITNIFTKIYTLPSFERYGYLSINNTFLYLSTLLDHIIDDNINTIIIAMAIDRQNK